MMELVAKQIAYSSVVGGGLSLADMSGRARFQVMFIGTTEGILKEEGAAIGARIADLINEHGLTVPDRAPSAPKEGE